MSTNKDEELDPNSENHENDEFEEEEEYEDDDHPEEGHLVEEHLGGTHHRRRKKVKSGKEYASNGRRVPRRKPRKWLK
ncbi:MAG: hypothetical protein IPM91_18735 [Bacteroidetes bacterium]|nr:hypothetical protein [Bacteroidota bacterium]